MKLLLLIYSIAVSLVLGVCLSSNAYLHNQVNDEIEISDELQKQLYECAERTDDLKMCCRGFE